MTPKKITTAVLLVFVAASVGYLVLSESGQQESAGVSAVAADDDGDKTVVYYFHATKRCKTCRTIESYAEDAIRSGFPDEVASGKIEWRTVNLDYPENEHFIDDYELATRTVVLVDRENGVDVRWQRLDRVWELVHDKQDFVDYIWAETNDFLADQNG
jgi:hypothetical protein